MRNHKLVAEVCRILFGTLKEQWTPVAENGQEFYVRQRKVTPKPGIMLYPLKRNTKQLIEGLKTAFQIFGIDKNQVQLSVSSVFPHDPRREMSVDVLKDEKNYSEFLDHTNNLLAQSPEYAITLKIPEAIYNEKIAPYLQTRINTQDETLEAVYCRINTKLNISSVPTISKHEANVRAVDFVVNSLQQGWASSKVATHRVGQQDLDIFNSQNAFENSLSFDAKFNRADIFLICQAIRDLCELLQLREYAESSGELSLSNSKFGTPLYQPEFRIWNLLLSASSVNLQITIRLPASVYQRMVDLKRKNPSDLVIYADETLKTLVARVPKFVQARLIKQGGMPLVETSYFDSDDEVEGNLPGDLPGTRFVINTKDYHNPYNRYKNWLTFDEEEDQTEEMPAAAAPAMPATTNFFSGGNPKDLEALIASQKGHIALVTNALKVANFTLAGSFWKKIEQSHPSEKVKCIEVINVKIKEFPAEVAQRVYDSEFYKSNLAVAKTSTLTL